MTRAAHDEPFIAQPDDAPQVALIEQPNEALTVRLALIDRARTRIDAQYYIWEKDFCGRLLAQRLFVAADRGVKVRVLLDDVELTPSGLPWLALDLHPNIEVRVFNPFRTRISQGWRRIVEGLLDFSRLNQRMHNKSLTVDDMATVIGGRNIGNAYFGLDPRANFRDLDVLATGSAARVVRTSFETFWASSHARPLPELARVRFSPLRLLARRRRLDRFARHALAGLHLGEWKADTVHSVLARICERLKRAEVEVLTDSPDKLQGAASPIADRFAALRAGAQTELLIESSYFVPGKEGVAALAELVARGVQVRVTTNSLVSTDVPLVHGGYSVARHALLRAGVRLHEARPNFPIGVRGFLYRKRSRAALHTKAAAIDRRSAFVGSMNLDPRSTRLNTEIGLLIHCPTFAGQVADALDRSAAPELSWEVTLDASDRLAWSTVKDGRHTQVLREPRAGWSRRAQAWLVQFLPVHHWL
jgi:putative cardiolipin synthase